MSIRGTPVQVIAGDIGAALQEAISKDVDLVVHCQWGFEGEKFASVCTDPRLRFLSVNSAHCADLSSLSALRNLESLYLRGKPGSCDLRPLTKLSSLSVDWTPDVILPDRNAVLRVLVLEGYAPAENSLRDLVLPHALEYLCLARAEIDSLEGIRAAERLREVRLFHCRAGLDLSGIAGSPSLEILWVENTKRITHWEALESCAHLRELVLIGCGDIQSLEFLKNNRALRRVIRRRTWTPDGGDAFLDSFAT